MSVTISVTLTVPLETFVDVRESACAEQDEELVSQVAYDTTYTIIDALKGDLYDINLKSNGDIQCRTPNAPYPISVKVMKLSDGKYFDVTINSNATGRELACKIHDQEKIPLLKQVLMHHGTIMFRRDAERSIDLQMNKIGVSDGSKIVLGWRF